MTLCEQNEQRKEPVSSALAQVMGQFVMNSYGSSTLMREILETICFGNDRFGVTLDFDDYVRVQNEVDRVWKDKREWTKRSILCTAGMGVFSSDTAQVLSIRLIMQDYELLPSDLECGTLCKT